MEGYQKSNLKGEGIKDLSYGVLIKDITPEFERLKLTVLDVKNEKPKSATFSLPKLAAGQNPINSRANFEEGETFPPSGWELHIRPGNVCRPDTVPAGGRLLLCRDLQSVQKAMIRAGLCLTLPARSSRILPMSWRLRADIRPVEMEMDEGVVIHPLAFLMGNEVVAAVCLRKIRNDKFAAGVLIRSADGLFRERIDVEEGEVHLNKSVTWKLDLIRLGTRQTTAVLRLGGSVVARINGDTTSVEPDVACVGILHRHGGLKITLHVDQLRLTEAPR